LFIDTALKVANLAFFSETYGFKPGVGGLAYLGLGLGFALATVFGAKFADQVYKYVSARFLAAHE